MQPDPPQSLPLFRAAFEHLPDPILLVGQSETVLAANAAARRLFALESPVCVPPVPIVLCAPLAAVLSTSSKGEAVVTQITVGDAGVAQSYELAVTQLSDEGGQPLGMLLHLKPLSMATAPVELATTAPDAPTLHATESALLKIGVALTSGLEMEAVLTAILDECRNLLPVDTLYVALYDRAAAACRFLLLWDQGTYYRPEEEIPLRTRRSLTRVVIESGQTLHLADMSDPETARAHPAIKIAGAPTRSWLGTPLLVQGEVIGVLSIQHLEPGRYTDEHVRLLEAVARQAAVAVENARLYAVAHRELAARTEMAERLALATEVASLGVWDWQADGNRLLWDERMYALHGMAPGTPVTLEAWRAAIHPDDIDAILKIIRTPAGSDTHAAVEYRTVGPDGSTRYWTSLVWIER